MSIAKCATSELNVNLVQLKVELRDTDIKRTIILPEDVSLAKFASIIMEVFGWNGCHLWEYERGRNIRYAIPDGADAERAWPSQNSTRLAAAVVKAQWA